MRALDDGAVATLHEAHHFRLSLDGKCSVHDTDAAFERDGFRHLRFGDAVHVGRNDRKLEARESVSLQESEMLFRVSTIPFWGRKRKSP